MVAVLGQNLVGDGPGTVAVVGAEAQPGDPGLGVLARLRVAALDDVGERRLGIVDPVLNVRSSARRKRKRLFAGSRSMKRRSSASAAAAPRSR
jgi:hypothetical protein